MIRGEGRGPGGCVRLSPRSCSSFRMLSCSISFACVSLNSVSVVCNCAFIMEPIWGWSDNQSCPYLPLPTHLPRFPAPQLSSFHQTRVSYSNSCRLQYHPSGNSTSPSALRLERPHHHTHKPVNCGLSYSLPSPSSLAVPPPTARARSRPALQLLTHRLSSAGPGG